LTTLSATQREQWERDGFFIVAAFASRETCSAMLDAAIAITRGAARGDTVCPAVVMPEAKRNPFAHEPEDSVSKIFVLHQYSVFKEFAQSPAVLDLVEGILGPDLDCFLSQFIFKNRTAMGQPWHQDSFYFPFSTAPQVGIWLAVTEATLANGCLHVLPGSQRENVHSHIPDRRPNANYGYLEIVDHDMSRAVAVTMQPGDLLVFHSHLMHQSTDNTTDGIRAAMVYHYTRAGTVDHSVERFGRPTAINVFVPVRRRAA